MANKLRTVLPQILIEQTSQLSEGKIPRSAQNSPSVTLEAFLSLARGDSSI